MGHLNAYATLETEGIKTNVKAFADILQLHEESQLQVMVGIIRFKDFSMKESMPEFSQSSDPTQLCAKH